MVRLQLQLDTSVHQQRPPADGWRKIQAKIADNLLAAIFARGTERRSSIVVATTSGLEDSIKPIY